MPLSGFWPGGGTKCPEPRLKKCHGCLAQFFNSRLPFLGGFLIGTLKESDQRGIVGYIYFI